MLCIIDVPRGESGPESPGLQANTPYSSVRREQPTPSRALARQALLDASRNELYTSGERLFVICEGGEQRMPRAHETRVLLLVFSLAVSLACIGGVAQAPHGGGSGRGAEPSSSLEAEQELFDRVNAYRVSKGLTALRWSDVVAEQARGHSRDMASGAAPRGHAGIEARVAEIRKHIPIGAWAENVVGERNADEAFRRLVDSRTHRRNLERDFDLTGVGAATDSEGLLYLTQIFVKSK